MARRSFLLAIKPQWLIGRNLHSHHRWRDDAVVFVGHESGVETTLDFLAGRVEGGLRDGVILGVEDEVDYVVDGGGDGVGCEKEACFAPHNDLFLLVGYR